MVDERLENSGHASADRNDRQEGKRGKNKEWTMDRMDGQDGQGIRVHLLSTQTGDSAGKIFFYRIDRGEEGLDT